MGFFKDAFSTLSMAMSGKIISQIDTPLMGGNCNLSLRLKRANENSDAYVVLAGIAPGNQQYYPMKAEEFVQFAIAVQSMHQQLSILNEK